MYFKIQKLADFNPDLAVKLKNYCYDITGCCQIVHNDMGPFLNEYMYQDALEIAFQEKNIPAVREFYFSVEFHGQRINHKHHVDFLVKDNMVIECKAVAALGPEHRQQLWNYMRLTKVQIGILYNFAPIKDQSERYYLDFEQNVMYVF